MGGLGWREWWHRLTGPTWRIVTVVEAADEVPERLPLGGVVLVQSGGTPKWLAFDCACGTGHRILLNLDPGRWPYWHFRHPELLSVSPSVDFDAPGKRCHYIVRRGRVVWVPDRSRRHGDRKRRRSC